MWSLAGNGYQSAPEVLIGAPSTGGVQALASASLGSGSGVYTLVTYSQAEDYFKVYKNLSPSSSLLSRPYTDRMNAVIKYFTDLGYTIVRETNPVTQTTFQWHVMW